MSRLQPAFACAAGHRVRAAPDAEQPGFERGLGPIRARRRYERPRHASAPPVDQASDQTLADTTLAGDEDAGISPERLAYLVFDATDAGTDANESRWW